MGCILSIILGAVLSFIILLIKITLFFLTHLDVTNSILVSALFQMLTIHRSWDSNLRIGMFIVGFAICLILQNISKIVKIIFGVFSACVVGFFAYTWKPYDSALQRNIIALVWFGIGFLWNVIYGAQGITGLEKNKAI